MHHVTTCSECGTPHVCPGPPNRFRYTTLGEVRDILIGQRVYGVRWMPLINGITKFTVNTDESTTYEWYVGEETVVVMDFLMKALYEGR